MSQRRMLTSLTPFTISLNEHSHVMPFSSTAEGSWEYKSIRITAGYKGLQAEKPDRNVRV
jgi:hypothetical protein